jgi:phosphate transport system substrate-binding protein
MRRSSIRGLIPLLGLSVAALVLAGCGGCSNQPSGSTNPDAGSVQITAGGATFPEPLIQKWAGEYKKSKIDYVAKGSGYGISNLTNKTIDFGCSDAPMDSKELAAAKAVGGEVLHLPVAIGGVAIIYNLEGVKDLKLSGEVLADIYLRKITKWNDPQIAALNTGVALPDKPIVPVARTGSSGTSFIFTEYLSKRSAEFATQIKATKSPKFPDGVEKKAETNGVTDYVKTTANTIGYVEVAYAKSNNIPFAVMKNKAGKFVTLDAASVTAAVDAAMKVKQDKEPYSLHPLAFSFTDADGDATYPIVGSSYAMLFQKQPKDKGPAIVEFLKWAVSDGQKLTTELNYAPLPAELTKKAQELLGTVTFE